MTLLKGDNVLGMDITIQPSSNLAVTYTDPQDGVRYIIGRAEVRDDGKIEIVLEDNELSRYFMAGAFDIRRDLSLHFADIPAEKEK